MRGRWRAAHWLDSMNINVCRFEIAATGPGQFPRSGLPEIAFMGRSNVGKSSLINRLLGTRRLARTSKTPGRTREIHFYRINDRIYFVDLPGYGYARVPDAVRRQWKELVESYLEGEGRPAMALQLVDGRHEPTALDRQLAEWLRSRDVKHRVVLTKIDKVARGRRPAIVAAAARILGMSADKQLLPVSALSGDGITALWGTIDEVCSARRSHSPDPASARSSRVIPPRARRDVTA